MSISVGAVAIGSWDNNVPIEPLLKEVDAALYLAKSTGRNRAVFADFSPQ
jgi:PleD family two-component response regulator